MATTRLLLPFTGGINTQALSYAIHLAEQRQAVLVPLALIRVQACRPVRLEYIQGAQDFLEFTRYKAAQHGVSVERACIYTGDVALSIEAVAGEMNCEAVILFLSDTDEALLAAAEIGALMERAACNAYIVLLPSRRARRSGVHAPLQPLFVYEWFQRCFLKEVGEAGITAG